MSATRLTHGHKAPRGAIHAEPYPAKQVFVSFSPGNPARQPQAAGHVSGSRGKETPMSMTRGLWLGVLASLAATVASAPASAQQQKPPAVGGV
jgi:hypothetical protein